VQIWRKMLQKALHELGEKAHLNLETFGNWTYNFNNSLFSKGSICRMLCWEPLADIFLKRFKQKYFQKYNHQERLDSVSSKNNVVLWRMSIGCQNYISKYNNPNDPDISISTQHTNIIGFSCTISQENIPIF
jgi:hypothetical protein